MYGPCTKSLKRRKLKDGQYNEQHKTGNEKTVIHMTMHQKAKDVATQTKMHWKPEMIVFVNFNSTLDICLEFIFIEMFDNFMTYTVSWYNTLHKILPVA